MNKQWVWLAIAFQILVLGFVAAKREWIRSYGEVVYLRTAPVDPRDIFRGDYVQLEYDIATLDQPIIDVFHEQHPEAWLRTDDSRSEQVVYLSLQSGAGDIAEVAGLSLEQPRDSLFIKARVGGGYADWRQFDAMRFGIEKYFVEQGAGIDIEKQRGRRNDWQTPMEVEVALGGDGTAVIIGHRWSDLGVRIEILQPVEARRNRVDQDPVEDNRRASPVLRVSLKNQSERVVRLPVSRNNFCEFKLLEIDGSWTSGGKGQRPLLFPNRDCSAYDRGDFAIKTLAPGDVHQLEVDLAQTQWHILGEEGLIELGRRQTGWRNYRWLYQAVKVDDVAAADLWQSSLKTASFNVNRVD